MDPLFLPFEVFLINKKAFLRGKAVYFINTKNTVSLPGEKAS